MEKAAELGVQFYGSYAISMVILLAWLGSNIVKKKADDKAHQKFIDKVGDAIVELNILVKQLRNDR